MTRSADNAQPSEADVLTDSNRDGERAERRSDAPQGTQNAAPA